MPEYFEGDCKMHNFKTYAVDCCYYERANPRESMTQSDVTYFQRTHIKTSIYNLTWFSRP